MLIRDYFVDRTRGYSELRRKRETWCIGAINYAESVVNEIAGGHNEVSLELMSLLSHRMSSSFGVHEMSELAAYNIFQNTPVFLLNSEDVRKSKEDSLEKWAMGQSHWYDEDFDHSVWRSSRGDYADWNDKEDERWGDTDDEPKPFGEYKCPNDEDDIDDKPHGQQPPFEGKDGNSSRVIIDFLGMHVHGNFADSYVAKKFGKDDIRPLSLGENSTWIVIYVDKIEKVAVNGEEFRKLFTTVLLHEMMHEMMEVDDAKGRVHTCLDFAYTTQVGYENEEMLANALMLALTRQLRNNKLYTYASCFVKRQPFAYRLGGEYFRNIPHISDVAERYVWQKQYAQVGFGNEWLKLIHTYRRDWDKIKALEETRGYGKRIVDYDGKYYSNLDSFVLMVVKEWIEKHPMLPSVSDIMTAFPDKLPNKGTMFKEWPEDGNTFEDNYRKFKATLKDDENFQHHCTEVNGGGHYLLKLKDGTLVVSGEFDDKNIERFVEHINALGVLPTARLLK
ncbi:MAG: hypothetical protein ACOYJG_05190 [Prevotella sp.]|jgi:hypothetical protein